MEGGPPSTVSDGNVGLELQQGMHGLSNVREVLDGQYQSSPPIRRPSVYVHHLQLPEILDTVPVTIDGRMM